MQTKENGKPVDYISKNDVITIGKRIDTLYLSCNLEPVASYINELSIEFENRCYKPLKSFDVTCFNMKLTELEITIESYFNRSGVDREKALSGIFKNRLMYEVHNTTQFEIRYFSCIELANPFIHKKLKEKSEFQLAKVFNNHYEVVHTPYF